LRQKKLVITAGPTREPLDPVRFLSNRSSGKMGCELAAEALSRGGEVVFISGPTALIPPAKATVINVQTAAEMAREVYRNLPGADALVMAAAVSDFKFETVAPQKIKKNKAPARVGLIRTEDILAGVRQKKRKKGLVVVGFAAETEDVKRNALAKLREKGLDLVVANDVSSSETGFESDFNQVTLFDRRGVVVETGRLTKREISRLIMDKIEDLLDRKN
jgi:phosphopantothenoylcysteine decarboxylase/phosphopantothenate--cysteine ligase